MPCKVCGKKNEIYTYCSEHFVDLWWKGEAQKDGRPLQGMPEVDLRKNFGECEFSICVIMTDPDYLSKSAKFVVKKLTKGKIHRNAQSPGGGMGHSYVRFRSPRLSTATRDYMTIGMTANGVSSPDPEANKYPLTAELAIDYMIDDAQRQAICKTIGLWLVGHIRNDPQYRYAIMSSNCTQFAKDCAEAANVYFCGNRMPSYSGTEGWNKTYTPSKLYGAMSKSQYAYDPRRDHSPGPCPPGFMGFQRNKLQHGERAGGYEFRKSLEQFKTDTGVKQESEAVHLMALVKKSVITKDGLIEALKVRSAKDVRNALQQID